MTHLGRHGENRRPRASLVLSVGLVLVLVAGACGSGDDDSSEVAAESNGDSPASTTSTTTTTTASTTTTTTTAAVTTSTAVSEGPVALDCTHGDAIAALLWNVSPDPPTAFAAFGTGGPPTGTIEITAFDPDARMLAARYWFPDPQGDGLAQGIVWIDGEVVGDVYYLDGADPVETGDVAMLQTGELLTLEVAPNSGGELVALDCWDGPKPARISLDDPLTIYGIGPVRVGMTLTDVIEEIGDLPLPDPNDEFEFSDGLCFHVPIDDSGVTLQMSGLGPGSSPYDATVAAVVVTFGGYSTPSGVSILTPQQVVEDALGSQLEISPHEYVEGFYLDFVPNDPADQDLRLRFVVTSDVVTEMRAGLAERTSLVEGCA